MNKKIRLLFSVLIIPILFLASCAPASPASIQASTTISSSPTSQPSRTSTRTQKLAYTLSPSQTTIPTVTYSPAPTLPLSTLMFLGTPISPADEPITSNNLDRLTQVAQWGRGEILGMAFTPDDAGFVVGSAFGLAVYDLGDLQNPPTWIPLNRPIYYEGLEFSSDGKFLRLFVPKGVSYVFEFPSGRTVDRPGDVAWIETTVRAIDWGDIEVVSSDGTKRLKSHTEYNEDFMDIEYTIREVYDVGSDKLLYKLPDETFYLTYNDRHQPEGCELESTELCGNAYSPAAYHPYEAAFAPTGNTLTILYRAPNFGNYNRYSLLRVYNAADGKLLEMIGNYAKPIQTFAYEPDGSRLLIGYVDGSIQLWDIKKNNFTSGAWHFNDYLNYAEFTSDGKYLLLRRPDALEVRSVRDGSLRSRYEAVAYSLSPVDSNIIAVADKDNRIKVLELDSGQALVSIPAHEYAIFSVAFSSDGRFIASSGQDCKIKLWDARTGEFIHYFEDTRANGYMGGPPQVDENGDSWGNSRIFIYSIYFVEGTNQVLGFGSWGTMVSWNINSGATNYVVYSAPLEFYNGMMTVSPHYPDSFGVDTTAGKFYIGEQAYDLQTGQMLEKFERPTEMPEDCVYGGPVSADGNLVFTAGYDNREGQVCVLDAHDNQLIRLIDVIPAANYDLTVAGTLLTDDGKTLLIATTMGTVNVYQISH